LHLVNNVENRGNGIVNYTIDLAIQQQSEGHIVSIASAGGAWVEFLGKHGVRHIELPQKGAQAAKALILLMRLLQEERQDVVHAQMVTGALLARAGNLLVKTPLITTVHNTQDKHAYFMSVGDCVIAVSEAVRVEMISRGIKASKLWTVRNGTIGSIRFQLPAVHQPITLRHPAILTAAGLYQRKGISDLLHAIRLLRNRIPGVTLYIAGGGPDRLTFENLAEDLGVADGVVFLGFRSDVRQLLLQADVFTLASHMEPFGLVLTEAREAQVPIVATRVGGIPEALNGGRAAILVEPHDPPGLASAFEIILSDSSVRDRLVAAGSEHLADVSVARMTNETLEVYRAAIDYCNEHKLHGA